MTTTQLKTRFMAVSRALWRAERIAQRRINRNMIFGESRDVQAAQRRWAALRRAESRYYWLDFNRAA